MPSSPPDLPSEPSPDPPSNLSDLKGRYDAETVLVLAPAGREADLVRAMLSSVGLHGRTCRDLADLADRPIERHGALLLTEEVLSGHAISVLAGLLDTQPAWSDLPVIIFLGRNGHRPAIDKHGLSGALGPGRNIVLLERPIRVRSFVSIVASSLLARRRQYELRDQLAAREKAEAHAQMLSNEMNHRIKNSLAMVGAIAFQTFRNGKPMTEALDSFSARLKSMALAQDVLTQSGQDGTDLHDLIEQALRPHRADDADHFEIEGPPVWIAGRMTTSFTMAMHELATNAVKYGALSVDAGRVSVRWRIEESPDARRLNLTWRERGGPPVTAPKRRGFGSRLVERSLAAELGGHARIFYEPEGITCEVCATLGEAG